MGMKIKSDGIDFADIATQNAFFRTKDVDKNLYKHLVAALDNIRENAFCGIQIPKNLIPKKYAHHDNLWKYNLPDAWRLIYTIKSPKRVEVISVILDWMNHKNYERTFRY